MLRSDDYWAAVTVVVVDVDDDGCVYVVYDVLGSSRRMQLSVALCDKRLRMPWCPNSAELADLKKVPRKVFLRGRKPMHILKVA